MQLDLILGGDRCAPRISGILRRKSSVVCQDEQDIPRQFVVVEAMEVWRFVGIAIASQ
jgi:hypothetical protein